jgi:hypothetical protein
MGNEAAHSDKHSVKLTFVRCRPAVPEAKFHSFLNSVPDENGQLHCQAVLSPIKNPVSIGQEAGFAPKTVCMSCRREKYLPPAVN